MSVTVERFRRQMELLAARYEVLSLAEASRRAWSLRLPKEAIAVTFDDGYADTHQEALPELKRNYIPATVFVTTGHLGTPEGFWWDDLEDFAKSVVPLPEELPGLPEQVLRAWRRFTSQDRGSFATACAVLRTVRPEAVRLALAQARSCAGVPAWRPAHQALSFEELREIQASPLLEVGAHTRTHARLSSLDGESQRREIEGSKRDLESALAVRIQSFAYPYGSPGDFTPYTCSLVQKAGFLRACANRPRIVRWGTDRFRLPRYLAGNWDGDEFVSFLDRALHGDS